jgi:hypothetical protein
MMRPVTMFRTVVPFLLALSLTSANSQGRYTISGRVLNEADQQPVANANVGLTMANLVERLTTTNADGTYTFTVSKLSPFIITVSKDGFEPFTTHEFPLEAGKFVYKLNLINLSMTQKIATNNEKQQKSTDYPVAKTGKKDGNKAVDKDRDNVSNTDKDFIAKKSADSTVHPNIINWSYKTSTQILVNKSGTKETVLKAQLMDEHILPTSHTLYLINVLNKNLATNSEINSGTRVRLPVVQEIRPEQKAEFSSRYSTDLSVSEKDNAVLLNNIQHYMELVALIAKIPSVAKIIDELGDVNRIFSIVQKLGSSLQLKVFQVSSINNELESFITSLLDILSRRSLLKKDFSNSKYFNEDMSDLINPILGKQGIKRTKSNLDLYQDKKQQKKGGPSANDDERTMDNESDEANDAVEPDIPVCFYIFESDATPSKRPCWVYCVPQRPYHQFLNKEITLNDLAKYKAIGKATAAYKTLATSFTLYFFAVSDDGVMSDAEPYAVYTIQKDSPNPALTRPYAFPIYLKVSN